MRKNSNAFSVARSTEEFSSTASVHGAEMNSRWCLCSVPLKILVLKSTCNDSLKILLFNENTGTAIITMKSTERNKQATDERASAKAVAL
jgi:hypothetical protein